MIRLANLLQAPTESVYQLVKTKTFALYLVDTVKWIKWKKWNEKEHGNGTKLFEDTDSNSGGTKWYNEQEKIFAEDLVKDYQQKESDPDIFLDNKASPNKNNNCLQLNFISKKLCLSKSLVVML